MRDKTDNEHYASYHDRGSYQGYPHYFDMNAGTDHNPEKPGNVTYDALSANKRVWPMDQEEPEYIAEVFDSSRPWGQDQVSASSLQEQDASTSNGPPQPTTSVIISASANHGSMPPATGYTAQGPSSASTTARTHTATSTSPELSRFQCLAENCDKGFLRAADLDRHLKHVHTARTPNLVCDYRRCPRREFPFHRGDHLRDHLRDYHKEDLPKRGAGGGRVADGAEKARQKWWRERVPVSVYGGWWRCGKCLTVRVSAETDGWRCPGCGNHCEDERQAMRKLPMVCGYDECSDVEGFSSPARFREHVRSVHGEDVPKSEGRGGTAELDNSQWWATRNVAAVHSPLWRCTRCLDAVDSGTHGFDCPRCGFKCEEIRRPYHFAPLVE